MNSGSLSPCGLFGSLYRYAREAGFLSRQAEQTLPS